jgi:hypothetical protein
MLRLCGSLLVCAALVGWKHQDSPSLPPGFAFFPSDNPWRWNIAGHAVHPLSDTYVASIGSGDTLFVEYGSFRFNVVTSSTPLVTINFTEYPDESDPGPGFGSPPGGAASGSWPIPPGALIEEPSDSHLIVVNTDTGLLYEAWVAVPPGPGGTWSAANGAIFDLNSNALRPDGWTSGDAAGLPILPGLLRWDEVVSGSINHALRFTVSSSQNTYIWPARHQAGVADTSLPPMGLRFRLKASFDTSGFSPNAQVILNCLKTYGMFVADNGSDWFINAVIDSDWDTSVVAEINSVPASEMEAVLTVDSAGSPIYPTGPYAPAPGGGGGGGGGGTPGGGGAPGGAGAGGAGRDNDNGDQAINNTLCGSGAGPITAAFWLAALGVSALLPLLRRR